ncbi:hypothetical protein CcI49_00905 [Frankia sp. CcI49]|uniref:hypothetical protein n=1 Tax=Frankia sp. CcI49 TaxID=1745382 RepID=UPI0009780944|nr:hypothetical protein [Frankia sp. CcI49]ONH62028.1 hypothetical protein CcI49_00905 [Frankia sp. CcI49]
MSGENITFDGDELANKVPILAEFRDDVVAFGKELADGIAQNNFAADAEDEASKLAYAMFRQVMQAFDKIYGALGTAIGVQGDRLGIVRNIGEATEAGAADTAGNWSGGGGARG